MLNQKIMMKWNNSLTDEIEYTGNWYIDYDNSLNVECKLSWQDIAYYWNEDSFVLANIMEKNKNGRMDR